MLKEIPVTERDMNDVLNRCTAAEDEGATAYPGMSYEQGVSVAIRWLTDVYAPHPFD